MFRERVTLRVAAEFLFIAVKWAALTITHLPSVIRRAVKEEKMGRSGR